MNFLQYLFWPNPGNASYSSPKVIVLLVVCVLLLLGWFGLTFWRSKLKNPITRKLSRSWSTASLWFGLVGLMLIVGRVEQISIVAMRALWLVWLASAVFYVFVQYKLFKARHYETLPNEQSFDAREKYLPKKKRS